MKNCIQCGFTYTPVSRKYYCCDKQQAVCSRCGGRKCQKCKKPRMNEMKMPRCDKCYCLLSQTNSFMDVHCGKHYCSKCLISLFRNAYKKVATVDSNSQQRKQLMVKLPCGDNSRFNALLQFFHNYCLQCGKEYRQAGDYEFKDGAKICSLCFIYFKDKYAGCFVNCNACGNRIQNYSRAGIAEQKELVLCVECYKVSQIEQKIIQNTKELNQSRKRAQSLAKPKFQKNNQPEIIQEQLKTIEKKARYQSVPKKKLQQTNVQRKLHEILTQRKFQSIFTQNKAEQKIQQKKTQGISPQKKVQQTSPKRKPQQAVQEKKLIKQEQKVLAKQNTIIQNNWIKEQNQQLSKQVQSKENIQTKIQQKIEQKVEQSKQQKKQQKQQKRQQKNQQPPKIKQSKQKQEQPEFYIVNHLTNDFQEVDQQYKQQLGLIKKPVFRKHLSDQTVVQKLIIEVAPNKPQDFIICQKCSINIPKKLACDLNYNPSSKKKSSTLINVNGFDSSGSSQESKKACLVCHVCYVKNKEKQKSLERSISTNDRSFVTNKTYKTSQFNTDTDYLGLNDSIRRQQRSPSVNLNKSYGLTGARFSDKKPDLKNSLPLYEELPKRQNTPIKSTHHTTKMSIDDYLNQHWSQKSSFKKCKVCGEQRKTMYHTGGQYFCEYCYPLKKTNLPYRMRDFGTTFY